MPRAATQRATPRPSHGDVTGNAAQSLRKEHAAAVRDAQRRMSTVGAAPDIEDLDPIEISDAATARDDDAAEAERLAEADARTRELSRSGLEIKALPRERPRRSMRSVSRDGKYDANAPVRVQFNDDYEGVTLGKNPETGELRTYDFEARRPYELPQWAADHFSTKEMLV